MLSGLIEIVELWRSGALSLSSIHLLIYLERHILEMAKVNTLLKLNRFYSQSYRIGMSGISAAGIS